jgi:cytochrome c peroxidase
MSRLRTGTRATIGRRAVALLAVGSMIFTSAPAWAVNLAAPPSLKTVTVPEPPNLGNFLRSDASTLTPAGYPTPTASARQAAIALGKALFWDMQVGSDGVQACATCHFHGGADNRTKNQVSPGLKRVDPAALPVLQPQPDNTFQVAPPNGALTPSMFPVHKYLDPDDRFSTLLRDANDVISSQGVHDTDFVAIARRGASDIGVSIPDPVFSVGGINTRRVEPRNAPTVINAVFNFANFWDGRANNVFNGANPFGDADPDAGIYVNVNGSLQKQTVRIPMGSLASQAVGPPGSDFEMSFAKRDFSDIGRKLLRRLGKKVFKQGPLAGQSVHPRDSVLGPYSRSKMSTNGRVQFLPGLNTTYPALVKAAFQDRYWNSTQLVTDPDGTTFTQMETNFSLFFGLAIQLYEATLVSDDSPYDRFQEGDSTALSASAQAGLILFMNENEFDNPGGSCLNCHGGPEFTNASVTHIGSVNFGASLPEGLLELMTMAAGSPGGGSAFYDAGYYDIGVRPIEDDPGRGGFDPFGYPLSFTDRALLMDAGVTLPFPNPSLPCGVPGVNTGNCPFVKRSATLGSFKAPTLRNVELTGPYFHNGGQATLRQVLDFYTRGGDFHEHNLSTLDPDIDQIFGFVGNDANKDKIIDFLLSLTDERVRWEKAPFDHPELFVPNGTPVRGGGRLKTCGNPIESCDDMLRIPPIGSAGLAAEGLPPIGTFLGLDPHQP